MTVQLPPGATAKHRAVSQALRTLIEQSQPGTRLPAERQLAEMAGVARMTLRQGLRELEDEGLVRRIPGRGTFVQDGRVAHTRVLRSFSDDMRRRGMTPGGRLVRVVTHPAPPATAERLELEPGAPVVLIERLRTANATPMAFERTELSAERFAGLGDLIRDDSSLFQLLGEHFATTIRSADQRIRIALLAAHEAALLEAQSGEPAFLISQVSRDVRGRPVEYGRSLYRHDRYEVVTRVER